MKLKKKKKLVKSTDIENIIEEKFSDIENERKLMAYVIRKNYKIGYELKKEYFTNECLKVFLELVVGYQCSFTKDIFVDVVKKHSNKKEQKINIFYALKLFQEDIKGINKETVSSIVKEIKEISQKRQTMAAVQEIVLNIEDFSPKKIKKILNPIYNLDRVDENNRVELLEGFEKCYDIVEGWSSKKNSILIPTGIRKLDLAIGGLQRGEVGLICGETGIGKSIVLSNIALNACYNLNKNVIFFSLEMPRIQCELRAHSWLAKILYSRFRMGTLRTKDEEKWIQVVKKYRKGHKSYFIIVEKSRGASAEELENDAYEIQEERGQKAELIITDYLNIMESNKKITGASKDHATQAEVAYDLKKMAAGFNGNEGIALWSGAQIKSDAYGKIIQTKHLKYSGGISEHTPVIVGISITPEDEFVNTMTVNIAKMRDGRTVTPFSIRPNWDYMTLDNDISEQKELGDKLKK